MNDEQTAWIVENNDNGGYVVFEGRPYGGASAFPNELRAVDYAVDILEERISQAKICLADMRQRRRTLMRQDRLSAALADASPDIGKEGKPL